MIAKSLLRRVSKAKVVYTMKLMSKDQLVERIKRFLRQPSRFELLFVGSIEGGPDALTPSERFAIWQKIGEIIDLARKMGVKVLNHGIGRDGRIFLVLGK
mgnify:CR=1 FL=1